MLGMSEAVPLLDVCTFMSWKRITFFITERIALRSIRAVPLSKLAPKIGIF
jgi:hypothetical protein